jgi:hypothetical protein
LLQTLKQLSLTSRKCQVLAVLGTYPTEFRGEFIVGLRNRNAIEHKSHVCEQLVVRERPTRYV